MVGMIIFFTFSLPRTCNRACTFHRPGGTMEFRISGYERDNISQHEK